MANDRIREEREAAIAVEQEIGSDPNQKNRGANRDAPERTDRFERDPARPAEDANRRQAQHPNRAFHRRRDRQAVKDKQKYQENRERNDVPRGAMLPVANNRRW